MKLEGERGGRSRLLLIAVIVVAAIFAFQKWGPDIDVEQLLEDISTKLGDWTYVLVGALAFLETGAFVGLVFPGETAVILAGAVAGQGETQIVVTIAVVWFCAWAGDTTSFFIGRRLGRGFVMEHGPKVRITPERFMQVERYFARHGGKTILIGRFIGLVRALAPFIAGSSGLAYRRFIPYSIVGTGLWATIFCVLGFIFWRSFDRVAKIAGQAVAGFGITVAVIVGVVVLYRRRAEIKAWLLAHQRHPLIRPLFAVGRPVYRRVIGPLWRWIAPEVRFVWNRVTPGDLGLELTTTLAVAGVGMFVFFLYVFDLSNSLNPTPLDTELLDIADRLYNEMAVDIAKVVTQLGALPTVIVLVLVTSIVLAERRRWAEIAVLVGGLALIYVSVNVTKGALDRPRPANPLVDTSFASFPSGHAAYAVAWIAVALVLTRRLGLITNAAVLLVAVAIAAVVGLTRIYLRAHYWSDVAAGWGLGCGIFAALTAIVLVVEYMRHNGRQREQGPPAPPLAPVER